MIPDKILTVITGVLLFLMMGFICFKLADCYAPEQVYKNILPEDAVFTQAYKDRLVWELAWTKKDLKKLTDILEN